VNFYTAVIRADQEGYLLAPEQTLAIYKTLPRQNEARNMTVHAVLLQSEAHVFSESLLSNSAYTYVISFPHSLAGTVI
jgi:hypothetical protein